MRTIKRYANRKLYDTTDSRYVTLQQIGALVASGEEVTVIENKDKSDITVQTLALIIAADQATGAPKYRIAVADLDRLIANTLSDGAMAQLVNVTAATPVETSQQ